MKTKIIVARETSSSATIRLTPETIGGLLGQVNAADYDRVVGGFRENGGLIHHDLDSKIHELIQEFEFTME